MARKRRFSDDAFGPTIERLMAEAGLTYRSLAEKTRLSAGYLNHLGARQPPGSVGRRDQDARATHSASRPSTSASTVCV